MENHGGRAWMKDYGWVTKKEGPRMGDLGWGTIHEGSWMGYQGWETTGGRGNNG